MKLSFYSKQDSPNCVVVSIALVQSELFWMCSVIFCLLRESKLLEHPRPLKTRTRAYSEPSTSSSQLKKDNYVILNEHDEVIEVKRRLSLPTEVIGFRLRPSAEDELVGNTCPPLWWQKTRVKLGHTAIHSSSKPTKSVKIALTPSISTSSVESLSTNNLSSSCSTSQKSSVILPLVNDSKYTFSLSPTSTRRSVQSCSSAESASLNEKQSAKRKLMSKLNAAIQLHYNRRKQSMNPKPL